MLKTWFRSLVYKEATPRGSSNFQKVEGHLVRGSHIVVHYFGDETTAQEPKPHGNTKHATLPHIRQAPGLDSAIIAAYSTDASALNVFQNMTVSRQRNSRVFVPRNVKKIRNVLHKYRQRRPATTSRDGFENAMDSGSVVIDTAASSASEEISAADGQVSTPGNHEGEVATCSDAMDSASEVIETAASTASEEINAVDGQVSTPGNDEGDVSTCSDAMDSVTIERFFLAWQSTTVYNSCPLDNLLMIMVNAAIQEPELLPLLRTRRNEWKSEKVLACSLDLIMKDEPDRGRLVWVCDALGFTDKSCRVDIYGGQARRFWDYLAHHLQGESRCSNVDHCPKPKTTFRKSLFCVSIGHAVHLQLQNIESACNTAYSGDLPANVEANHTRVVEAECFDGDEGVFKKKIERQCNGVRTTNYRLADGSWVLPLSLESLDNFNFTLPQCLEFFAANDSIDQSGIKLKLRGLTVNQSDHFVSFLRFGNRWYFYDGLKNSGYPTKEFPSESSLATMKPSHVVYTV
jgi:hypothetical protein